MVCSSCKGGTIEEPLRGQGWYYEAVNMVFFDRLGGSFGVGARGGGGRDYLHVVLKNTTLQNVHMFMHQLSKLFGSTFAKE